MWLKSPDSNNFYVVVYMWSHSNFNFNHFQWRIHNLLPFCRKDKITLFPMSESTQRLQKLVGELEIAVYEWTFFQSQFSQIWISLRCSWIKLMLWNVDSTIISLNKSQITICSIYTWDNAQRQMGQNWQFGNYWKVTIPKIFPRNEFHFYT